MQPVQRAPTPIPDPMRVKPSKAYLSKLTDMTFNQFVGMTFIDSSRHRLWVGTNRGFISQSLDRPLVDVIDGKIVKKKDG